MTGYLSWYWFRPIFGVVIAFAIYLLYKTGAAALGSGTDSILAADVNLPMLALISLFAGLLSWHSLEVIEARGRRWFDSQKREDLYASGLEAALRNAGRSPSELAVQIARTPTQIDRWIAGRDKVTPEMQDRISTWLDRPRIELFSKDEIDETKKSQMLWATGLKRGLDKADTSMDMVCATNLRSAIRVKGTSIASLAGTIGGTEDELHGYVELEGPVPAQIRAKLASALGVPHEQIFVQDPPSPKKFLWAPRLRGKMAECGKTAADLAREIGGDVGRIRNWMEMDDVDILTETSVAPRLRSGTRSRASAPCARAPVPLRIPPGCPPGG